MATVYAPILIILSTIIVSVRPLYLCNKNDVVQIVQLEKEPVCPTIKDIENNNTLNGSIYLFKPNYKKLNIAAYRCRLRSVKVTIKRDCGFWLCSGSSLPYYEYSVQPVSIDTCMGWIKSGICQECSNATTEDPQDCKFVDENDHLRTTKAKIKLHWPKSLFGTAIWSGYNQNCEIVKGVISTIRPWKKIVSSWGTLSVNGTQPFTILGSNTFGYRDFQKTIVWNTTQTRMKGCNYNIHSENAGHLISYGSDSNLNSNLSFYTHLVVPKLQTTFKLLQNAKNDYAKEDECFDAFLAKYVNESYVYTLAGDLIAVFVPISVSKTVVFKKGNRTHPIHGYIANMPLSQNMVTTSKRKKRNWVPAKNALQTVSEAKLSYFLKLFSRYHYTNAKILAENLCKKELELFKLWRLQAKVRPSEVMSHLLKYYVMANPIGDDRYEILACKYISPAAYTVVPSLFDKDIPEKCYTLPLIETAEGIFQVTNKKRIVYPPTKYGGCLKNPPVQTFTIDEREYTFVNYTLTAGSGDSPENGDSAAPVITTISPQYIPYTNDLKTIDIQHIPLYKSRDISISFVDSDTLVDYVNQEIKNQIKFKGAKDSFVENIYHSRLEINGIADDILIFFNDLLGVVNLWFINPITQTAAILFITVPVIDAWFHLLTICCRIRKTETFSPSKAT